MFLFGCAEKKQSKLLEAADGKLSESKYSEATELLRKVVSINPENKLAIKAMYKLGFILEVYAKDFTGAVFNYQEAIRLSHDPASIYEIQKRVANIFYEQAKDSDKAIEAYRKLMLFNPKSLELDLFQFRMAESFFRQNNFDQARTEYQQLVEKFPKSQYVEKSRFEIGNTYYMEGKYDIALDAFKQVTRYHPQSEYAVEAEFLMAQCLEQTDKLDTALMTYDNIRNRYGNPKVLEFRISELKKRIKKESKQ
ncbi:MAG: outer membrane protein assembly factor BamD [Proteobacteria bacterium]|nr:outer membrane protein assembly factor BamD [Pseudomonadota bacterium]NBY18999.1 outer membrane protein assembly factor BamD [bacterium]